MTTGQVFFVAGLVLAPLYLVYTRRHGSALRTLVKVTPLSFFTLASLLAGSPPFLTIALFLSALGDFALSREGRAAFLYGLSSFALAHVCFIVLFQSLGSEFGFAAFGVQPVVAALIVLAAFSSEIWLAPFTGNLRWPVRAYVTIIAFMALTALTLPPGFALIVAGALLFMASDGTLSMSLFRLAPDDPCQTGAAWALWILYIAAVALISWGTGSI